MTDYSLTTKKNWLQTKIELEDELRKWGITDYVISPANQTSVTLRYVLRGQEVLLSMNKQARAQDNLRVLYLCIHSMRLNELRGMGELLQSAYLQLSGGKAKRNPYDVLMILPGSPIDVAEAVYKNLAMKYHPDRGGNVDQFKELNEAIAEIRKEKNG